MTLDDFKETIGADGRGAALQDSDSLNSLMVGVHNFDRSLRRNFVIEVVVAAIAMSAVVAAILGGHYLYPRIVGELFPGTVGDTAPTLNTAMYASLVLMALYCLVVPMKRYLAEKSDVSLSWTLSSRVDAEISRMEKQHRLWSTSHIWSIAPAALIGVLFFWGLNKSLLGTWMPSVYLWLYFGFVALSAVGGLWLRKDMVSKNIQPLLDQLYGLRQELRVDMASSDI